MKNFAQPAQTLNAAIGRHVGDLDTVLRAHLDEQTYAGLTEERRKQLQGQLDNAIAESTSAFADLGYNADTIDHLSRKAWRADLGTAALKATFTNAASSGVVGLLVLAATIPLGLVLPSLALIGVALALTLVGSYRYGVHAWAAGLKLESQFDETTRPDGSKRERFSACPTPAALATKLRHAGKTEAVRSGIRLATALPGQVASAMLSLFAAAPLLMTGVGVATGFASVAVGPFSNGLAAAVNQHLRGRQRSMAPLLGISVDRKTGHIQFDPTVAQINVERLACPATQRSWRSISRLAGCYRSGFKAALRAERQVGPQTPEKRTELLMGSPVATKGIQSSLDSLNAMAHTTGFALPFFNVFAAVTAIVGGGVLHAAKRPISDHLAARSRKNETTIDGIVAPRSATDNSPPSIRMPTPTGLRRTP
ncbi:hypothetical protein LMG19083_04691 [Ralstonia psammae]|uniref:Transmembrane protein n=1 Tax=Ralstonia psammae TaxID=3058598 RepID=A0ABN9JGI8_9RALS|nr:hypothetical protein [Ralstonia sp. LMG 19083]CAJ0808344.1 hypothetical protein LMG19083_04691 [Ralstonia sp. LMG 19083]